MLSLIIFLLFTIYAGNMESSSEFWLLGFAVALVLGGSQSLSRSLFSGMLPSTRSAEFFSFFAISSKFASIFGPFTFALLVDLTGSNRIAIFSLATFFLLGIILLAGVKVDQARLSADTPT
ncbi:MAG: hypothetical protein C0614_13160 [Desulfuromonas sp.]|nr:MAG: hypothetical protein C0614_13160 [Desulfuromonas sp.]